MAFHMGCRRACSPRRLFLAFGSLSVSADGLSKSWIGGVFSPPPGTRLLPIPRKMDAPEVGDLTGDLPLPETAFAQAEPNEKHAKSASVAVRKRTRVIPREHDEPALGYAQQWNGFGGWNGDRAWNDNSKFTATLSGFKILAAV